MARIRHLNRAPIAEAVIELRIRPAGGLNSNVFLPLSQQLATRYPTEEKVQSLEATFGMKDGKPIGPDASYAELGVLRRSADQREVVQLRTNGFSFSRLAPYTSWEEVLPKALALWTSYRDLVKPERLIRLGVRYVNRLTLPVSADLSAFLTAAPVVPGSLPQSLRSYLTRSVLHDPQTGNSILLTQASEPSSDQEHLTILLDVDAFREADIDAGDDRLLSLLESLRNLKNRAFFGSVTEQTLEMYE